MTALVSICYSTRKKGAVFSLGRRGDKWPIGGLPGTAVPVSQPLQGVQACLSFTDLPLSSGDLVPLTPAGFCVMVFEALLLATQTFRIILST